MEDASSPKPLIVMLHAPHLRLLLFHLAHLHSARNTFCFCVLPVFLPLFATFVDRFPPSFLPFPLPIPISPNHNSPVCRHPTDHGTPYRRCARDPCVILVSSHGGGYPLSCMHNYESKQACEPTGPVDNQLDSRGVPICQNPHPAQVRYTSHCDIPKPKHSESATAGLVRRSPQPYSGTAKLPDELDCVC